MSKCHRVKLLRRSEYCIKVGSPLHHSVFNWVQVFISVIKALYSKNGQISKQSELRTSVHVATEALDLSMFSVMSNVMR